MTAEQNSNNTASAMKRREPEGEPLSASLRSLMVPSQAVILRRESHVVESVIIQDVNKELLYSLFSACKIPITPEGAEQVIRTLLREEIPSGRTLSGKIQANKTVQFKGFLELCAGRGHIGETYGFQLLNLPDYLPDIVLARDKARGTLSLSMMFDLSELKNVKSMYVHWQKCERVVHACGSKIPQNLLLNRLGRTGEEACESGTEWYRAQLSENIFISVADLSRAIHQRGCGNPQVSLQRRLTVYHPRMILFNTFDTKTISRVIGALEVAKCGHGMSGDRKDALVRILGLITHALEKDGGYTPNSRDLKGRYLGDLLFEFARNPDLLYVDIGLQCEAYGGWKSRSSEFMDCVEVKVHGFTRTWGDAFSLFVRFDPNQGGFPILGLEWDQGSVDQKGAEVTTLHQIESFLSAYLSSHGRRKFSPEEVRKSIICEMKDLPQDNSPLLFRPLALGSESINLGFYERTSCGEEEPIL